jgi:hypothetical protein
MTKTAARYSWQEARAHDRTNGYCRAQKAGGDSFNLAFLLLLKTPSIWLAAGGESEHDRPNDRNRPLVSPHAVRVCTEN